MHGATIKTLKYHFDSPSNYYVNNTVYINAPAADNHSCIFHTRGSALTYHINNTCYVIMYSRAAAEVKIKVARNNTSETSIFPAQLSCAGTTRLCRPPCY